MSVEQEQLAQVAELVDRYGRYGIRWHHCGNSRWCVGDAGLPDLLLVGPRGVLFRELKSSPRHVTPEQTAWSWSLRAAGADVGLWLPSHGRDGTIEREIAVLAGQ